MAHKAIRTSSDSSNPVAIHPRNERIYTLTKLGHEACRYFEQLDKAVEQIEQAVKLPMDDLPHLTIKRED